jgi:high-affinity iron transporter
MGSFVITLREGFEAALIVSLILAYLAKTGRLQEHGRTVWLGVAAGVAASIAIGAILFASAGELEGNAEALYEGTAMIAAAAVVTWMAFWMRRQAATIGRHLREQVSESLRIGGGFALASVAFIGVAREGVETALFLFASTGESGAVVTMTAGVAGLAAAIVLGVLFYRGALRMNLSRFFLVTSVLIIAFAAFLIYSGIHELGEVAESEALELAGPLAALLYGAGFAALYIRDARRPAASRPAEPEPQPESPA